VNRSLPGAAMLALLVVALTVPALAVGAFATNLSITYSRHGGGRFSGRVTSPKAACVAGRRITVYRRRSGRDSAVGSGSTSGGGRWRVYPPGKVATGDYYARTPAVKVGAGGSCAAARSIATHAS
jgi:hypothetical protein